MFYTRISISEQPQNNKSYLPLTFVYNHVSFPVHNFGTLDSFTTCSLISFTEFIKICTPTFTQAIQISVPN